MSSRVGLRVPVVLLAAFAARGAPAADVDVGRLREWHLPAYTLIAEDGYDPRRIVPSLANSERVLSKLLATPVKSTMVPTTVWLVPRRVWNRFLAPSHAIAGEFVPHRFANTLVSAPKKLMWETSPAPRVTGSAGPRSFPERSSIGTLHKIIWPLRSLEK